MQYVLRHAYGMVDIALAGDRLTVRTQGTGALDKLKTIDISLSDLKQFCIVPTIGAQNAIGRGAYDASYQSEFIFSYRDGAKIGKKRVFVNGADEAFKAIVSSLAASRPDASLLHLPPAEAQKQIGVMSGKNAVILIVALVIAIPIIVIAIVIATGH